MRQLSASAAKSCEEATTPHCRCRCGGALHGARRNIEAENDGIGWFAELPEDDPHSITWQQANEYNKKIKQLALPGIFDT